MCIFPSTSNHHQGAVAAAKSRWHQSGSSLEECMNTFSAHDWTMTKFEHIYFCRWKLKWKSLGKAEPSIFIWHPKTLESSWIWQNWLFSKFGLGNCLGYLQTWHRLLWHVFQPWLACMPLCLAARGFSVKVLKTQIADYCSEVTNSSPSVDKYTLHYAAIENN